MDFVFLALVAGLAAATFGLVFVCELLQSGGGKR